MAIDSDNELERQISEWRSYMRGQSAVHEVDVEELEDHLRSTIAELTGAGLRADEAFLVAVKRMGGLDELSREFAREHSERLWKQLMTSAGDGEAEPRGSSWLVMAACAASAAVAIKVPALFGFDLENDISFYARNFGLFALSPLAVYFISRRRPRPVMIWLAAALFVVGALGANIYRLDDDSQSLVLTAIHLPIALWLVVGALYASGDWRSSRKRMDFVRFTGEWFIYFALMAAGGGVLAGITYGVFEAIGIDAGVFLSQWMLPCGAVGAVVVSAWLVEAKQSVIENMAPVLTKVFTPLFTAVLLAFLAAVVATNSGIIDVERDVLILFDVMLVVVLGLLLYAISAQEPGERPGMFHRLQLALVVAALAIDALVLTAVVGRIAEFGSTPNKVAALGNNLILLCNLVWSAWLFAGFIRHRMPFGRLEQWQTRYAEVYGLWAWTVVLILPPGLRLPLIHRSAGVDLS